MPDIDILVELADYYAVELRELLDGERKYGKTIEDTEETVLKAVEYSNEDKLKITNRMHILFIGGLAAAVLYMILYFTDRADNFLGGLCQGIMLGMMIVGVIITGKHASKISEFKTKLISKR